jgi:mono/diheme cytochrome c family protein
VRRPGAKIRSLLPEVWGKNSMKRLLVFFVISLLLAGCNFSLAADVTPPPGYQPPLEAQETAAPAVTGPVFPIVPPDPANGAPIYAEKCAPCHGESGLGNGPNAASLPNPVPPLGSPEVARAAVPSDWFTIVTQGNLERFMPPFRSLTDPERWDVVAYALNLHVSQESLASGAELYQANCAACHGESGEGDGPQAAGLAVPDLTDQEFMAGRSANDLYQAVSQGVGQSMPAFGEKLSEAELWALVDYTRSLTFTSSETALATPQPGQATPQLPQETPVGQSEALTTTLPVSDTLGIITGFVMNGSGGQAPAGAVVNLHAFDQMTVVYTATTTLDEDGSYTFVDLDMPPGRAFLTTMDYGGVIYGSDLAVAEEGKASLELPLQIYESTSDTAGLSVDRLHYFFEFVDDQTIRVLELYIVSNPGDKTVAAAKEGEPVLTFHLPEGAANLQFENGELGQRFIQTPDGFADTTPIRPGSANYQVLYSYELPYKGKLELKRPVDLPVQAVVILVPEESVKIKGEGIQDAGSRDIQGLQYHMYNGPTLQPGNELQLTVTGKPQSGAMTVTAGSNTNLIVGAAVLGVVLLVAGVWLYQRSRPAPDEAAEDETPVAVATAESPESLMDAILALDDLYQEGKLPEEAYLQRRSELKRRLERATGN